MDDSVTEHFTYTFSIDARAGWVLVFLTAAVIGSLAIYASTGQLSKKAETPKDRMMKALGIFAVVLTPIWFCLLGVVLWALVKMSTQLPQVGGSKDDMRWGAIAFVGLLTALAGLLGTPLALLRVYTTERQTRTAEQSHVTDQISKAVEQLASVKTVRRQRKTSKGILSYEDLDGKKGIDPKKPIFEEITLPHIEVRIGGLFALERVKNTSKNDHLQIMKILCAFIRENAREQAAEHGVAEQRGPVPLREDIATAFRILNDRSAEQRQLEAKNNFRLDFRNTNFSNLSLQAIDTRQNENSLLSEGENLNLDGADFSHSVLVNTNFRSVGLNNSVFRGAELQNAKFSGSSIKNASFMISNCDGARFDRATMDEKTNFRLSNLTNAYFNLTHITPTMFSTRGALDNAKGTFRFDRELDTTNLIPSHWEQVGGGRASDSNI